VVITDSATYDRVTGGINLNHSSKKAIVLRNTDTKRKAKNPKTTGNNSKSPQHGQTPPPAFSTTPKNQQNTILQKLANNHQTKISNISALSIQHHQTY